MFPFLSTLEELRGAKEQLATAKEELRVLGVPFDERIEVGAMIEIRARSSSPTTSPARSTFSASARTISSSTPPRWTGSTTRRPPLPADPPRGRGHDPGDGRGGPSQRHLVRDLRRSRQRSDPRSGLGGTRGGRTLRRGSPDPENAARPFAPRLGRCRVLTDQIRSCGTSSEVRDLCLEVARAAYRNCFSDPSRPAIDEPGIPTQTRPCPARCPIPNQSKPPPPGPVFRVRLAVAGFPWSFFFSPSRASARLRT